MKQTLLQEKYPVFTAEIAKGETTCQTVDAVVGYLKAKIAGNPNPQVLAVRPRSIGVADMGGKFVVSFLEAVRTQGEEVGYLTFVPDGKPTLDVHLGEAIDVLRPLGLPVAVISNASLIWRPEVRAALGRADWVSVKVGQCQ